LTTETDRAAAGARYVAALTEYRAAFIELAAHDLAVSTHTSHAPGFGAIPDVIPMRHGTFSPDWPVGGWGAAVAARRAEIVANGGI
jgi:hypothetical protein